MADTCSICIDPYTKQPQRKKATCPYCDIQACVKCTQTYLLNSQDDPHCMGCRKGWSREVMDSILLTSWLNGEQKKHRENILIDREKSRLPAAQIIVERRKAAKALEPECAELLTEIHDMEMKLHKLRMKHEVKRNHMMILWRGEDPFAARTGEKPAEERRAFIMPCPASGCRGFLSQAQKCGVCDLQTCPECRELKGEKDAAHTCDPNNVETVRTLKKECRACPQCGTNIFKIVGCDQMYCTSCNTPFSWTTGKKITSGVIHNPHYFDFLRATNGGVMPRTPGDIPCGDNLPSAQQQDRDVLRKQYFHVEDTSPTFLQNFIRILGHIRHDEIPRTTNHQEDSDNTDSNCRYLMNEITETRWKQLLQQKEKRRMRRDEIRLCQEAFVGAGVDILGRLFAGVREVPPLNTHTSKSQVKLTADGLRKQVLDLCEESSKQILALTEIFHQSLLQISQRQKCQVMKLDINKHEVKITKQKAERLGRKRKDQGEDDDETTSDVDDDSIEDAKPKNKLVRT